MNISRELFEAVLGDIVFDSDIYFGDNKNEIVFNQLMFCEDFEKEDPYATMYDCSVINIYELMYKCKLWAISKNYRLISNVNYELDGECKIYKNNNVLIKHVIRDTEFSAVSDACEWILQQERR